MDKEFIIKKRIEMGTEIKRYAKLKGSPIDLLLRQSQVSPMGKYGMHSSQLYRVLHGTACYHVNTLLKTLYMLNLHLEIKTKDKQK